MNAQEAAHIYRSRPVRVPGFDDRGPGHHRVGGRQRLQPGVLHQSLSYQLSTWTVRAGIIVAVNAAYFLALTCAIGKPH